MYSGVIVERRKSPEIFFISGETSVYMGAD